MEWWGGDISSTIQKFENFRGGGGLPPQATALFYLLHVTTCIVCTAVEHCFFSETKLKLS